MTAAADFRTNKRRIFMAKFKVGDRVWVPAKQKRGVIRGVSTTGNQYDIEFMGGGGAYVNEDGLELLQALGNSACKNAKFKVGDKVTYWVFDKKLNGSVKAVRGESVDIDDGHGGVVTFKAKDLEVWNARACNAKFIKGDFVKVKGWPGTFRIDIVNPDGTYVLKKYPGGQPTIGSYKESELELEEANAKACNSRNPIVAKAMNACGTAKNAGIWESTEEAEDRSDVFVRAALGRTKYNFDGEAQTLREVIKLLASAEQTPKIKKNTDRLKGILSRVEKASALFKGI